MRAEVRGAKVAALGLLAVAVLAGVGGSTHDDFEADGAVWRFRGPEPASIAFSQGFAQDCSDTATLTYTHGVGNPLASPRVTETFEVDVEVEDSPDGCIGFQFDPFDLFTIPQSRAFHLDNEAEGVRLSGLYTVQFVGTASAGAWYENWVLDGSLHGEPGAFYAQHTFAGAGCCGVSPEDVAEEIAEHPFGFLGDIQV